MHPLVKETEVGRGAYIGAGVSVAKGVVIGTDVWIGDNVTIKRDCNIGNNVVIESGVLIEQNVTVLAGRIYRLIRKCLLEAPFRHRRTRLCNKTRFGGFLLPVVFVRWRKVAKAVIADQITCVFL